MKAVLLSLIILIFAAPATSFTPDNVSIELTLDSDQAYIDGTNIGSTTTSTSFDYSYIVSTQPLGIVGYGTGLEIRYTSGAPDKFKLVQKDGSFIIPFTSGGYETIENSQAEVKSRDLLAGIEQSFNFFEPTTPTVKALYLFDYTISSFEGPETDIRELSIRNRINNKNYTELKIRTD